jgi:hypothetical protein
MAYSDGITRPEPFRMRGLFAGLFRACRGMLRTRSRNAG